MSKDSPQFIQQRNKHRVIMVQRINICNDFRLHMSCKFFSPYIHFESPDPPFY